MTKKSQSRIQRDIAKKELEDLKKNNNAWDDLQVIYINSKNQISVIGQEIINLFSIKEIYNYLENRELTANMIRCLSQDITSVTNDLEAIYSSHKDKTGQWVDEDDFISSLSIFEAYTALQARVEGTILPNIVELTKQFDNAVETIKKDSQSSNEVNGVVDVKFDEVNIEAAKVENNE